MRSPPVSGLAFAGGAVLALGLGGWTAAQHPLWPGMALLALLVAAAVAARWPSVGVVAFAALLPVIDLGMYTGRWLADESDLLVWAVLAGGACRLAWRASVQTGPNGAPPLRPDRALLLFLALCAGAVLSGLLPWLGQPVAVGDPEGVAWRSSKAFVWSAALLPLWLALHRGRAGDLARLWLVGQVLGLGVVCLSVLLELVLHTGWPLASPGYRTVGRFWEMRLGGGAIDVYLAATLPMAAWALVRARGHLLWWALALLLMVGFQVLVSTQSRALMVAAGVAIALVAVLARRCEGAIGERSRGRWWCLAALIGLQVAWGIWVGSDLQRRVGATVGDFGSRLSHWGRALDVARTPAERWGGVGAGQVPWRYGAVAGDGEFAGLLSWAPRAAGGASMVLSGPVSDPRIGVQFGVAQRVYGWPPGTYTARLRLRTAQEVRLLVSFCERHVLYDRRCQWRYIQVAGTSGGEAASVDVVMRGDAMERESPLAGLRAGLFAVSLLTPGATIALEQLELFDAQGHQWLANPGLRDGRAHWIEAAQGRFEPWHVDNLYLEFLIERGLAGVLLLLAAFSGASVAAWWGIRAGSRVAPAYLASAVSVGLLGLLISVAEMPRLMLLLWLTLGMCMQLKPKTSHKRGM